MKYAELVAKNIIEALRRGCELKFRKDQSNGEWDFDLLCAHELIAAVEVTMATDARKLRTRARISNPARGGPFVTALRCKKGWSVDPIEGADIRKIREKVDECLAAVEATGVEEFCAFTDAAGSLPVSRIFCDLGIEAGRVTKWKPPVNRIAIGLPGGGGKVQPSVAIEAILFEANKYDNRKKLANAGVGVERHLFVYVDQANYLPSKVLVDTPAINMTATLPTELTHIWAASEIRSENKFVVWKAQNGCCWEVTKVTLPSSLNAAV